MDQNTNGVVNKLQHKHHNISTVYNDLLKEHVQDLSTSDIKLRVLSFLLDAIFMFWPSIIFIISLLLLTSPANIGGEIIRNTFELTIIYVVSILVFNTASALYYRGQTIGMRYYGLKIVTNKYNELTTFQLILREFVGISLPWVLILLSFTVMGFNTFFVFFLVFIIVNTFVIIVDKKHRSIIDFFLRTTIVLLPDVIEEVAYETTPQEVAEENNITEEKVIDKDLTKTNMEAENNEKEAISSTITNQKRPETIEIKEEKKVKKPEVKVENSGIENQPNENVKQKLQKVMNTVISKPKELKPIKEEKSSLVTPIKPDEDEKSVTEIISEAVSVVDQALESKNKDFSVNISNKKTPDMVEKQKVESITSDKMNEKTEKIVANVTPKEDNTNTSLDTVVKEQVQPIDVVIKDDKAEVEIKDKKILNEEKKVTNASIQENVKPMKDGKSKNNYKNKKVKKGNSQKGNSKIKVKDIKSISSIKKASKND